MEIVKKIVFGDSDDKPVAWGPGVRSEHIIHYVTKGRGRIYCNGREYTVTAGESFVVRPYRMIRYVPDTDDPWGYAWCIIDAQSVEMMMEQLVFKQDDVTIGYVEPAKIVPLYRMLDEVGNFPEAAMTRYGLAHAIVGVYLDAYPQHRLTASEALYERAVQIVERKFHSDKYSVADIAADLNISGATLYRLFVTKSGLSPNTYLQSYRIQQAQKMLKAGLTIKETALSCGFSDQFYFSKAFKKIAGLTPTEYKQREARR